MSTPTLTCPHCGEKFTFNDSEIAQIMQQIHNIEFEEEVNRRVSELKTSLEKEFQSKIESSNLETKLEVEEYKRKINEIKSNATLNETNLKNQIDMLKKDGESQLSIERQQKVIDIANAVAAVRQEMADSKNEYEAKLKETQLQLEYYKDLKTKMSTKMVGETLEQHCQIEFNKLRATAFRNAYFEKDNDARTGSKGDFIYRECDEDGVEFISIMFEMKNEMDTTEHKHTNEYFLKELDKDRKEKKCEYAILVSMLEADNELYNMGIVDVSYKYDKMYVIRPQFFIPIITLLRNAALNSLDYKHQLMDAQNQNIDITHFEENLFKFKDDFSKNYERANRKFNEAIDEIDKSIDHLQKIKDALLSSDRNLRIANNKADDLTINKLTKNCPSMREKFREIRENPSLIEASEA